MPRFLVQSSEGEAAQAPNEPSLQGAIRCDLPSRHRASEPLLPSATGRPVRCRGGHDESKVVDPLERTAEWKAGKVPETYPFGVDAESLSYCLGRERPLPCAGRVRSPLFLVWGERRLSSGCSRIGSASRRTGLECQSTGNNSVDAGSIRTRRHMSSTSQLISLVASSLSTCAEWLPPNPHRSDLMPRMLKFNRLSNH
jgi:hypothetical protein